LYGRELGKVVASSPNTPNNTSSSNRPVIILGISLRSGTNFLSDLIGLHPRCARFEDRIPEDYLVHYGKLLAAYTTRLHEQWKHWNISASERDRLMQRLGGGLEGFLMDAHPGKRVVSKTPSVKNIRLLPILMPEADLIIIVRDGRSVVESGMRTFGWPMNWAADQWAHAAREITAFEALYEDSDVRYRIVRYEDLVTDLSGTMVGLLEFLNLEEADYDFKRAADLPLRGSSTTRMADGEMNWTPVDKPDAFDSLGRFAHWSPRQHARFNWFAASSLSDLGYKPVSVPISALQRYLIFPLLNVRRRLSRMKVVLMDAINTARATLSEP
jgi:hypothetical protein